MATDAQDRGLEDERVRVLRDAIRRSFAVMAYARRITNCDGAWLPELNEENAIHDDDKIVYEALTGRTWPDIGKDFLREEPDGFVLLADKAFVTYLAAWLMGALDDMDGENIVREFLVYAFSPSPQQPDLTPRKIRRLKLLNAEQQATLRSLLAEFAERERSDRIRKSATSAVELIDQMVSDRGGDLSIPKF